MKNIMTFNNYIFTNQNSNKYIFIKSYTGYGDWISLNGLIRFLSTKYEEVYLISDGSDISFVTNLYRDNQKIKVVDSSHLNNVQNYDYLDLLTARQEVVDSNTYYNMFNQIGVKFGFPKINLKSEWFYPQFITNPTEPSNFTEDCKDILENNASAFYVASGIPKEYRIENFYYQRDYESENTFYENLNLPKKYIIISEYGDNLINKDYIKNKSLPVININQISQNYFDIIKVIENAEEVHLMENSTALMAYHLQYKNIMNLTPINLHTYIRTEMVRKCTKDIKSNIFLDMLLCPRLKNWNFIYD